MQTMFTIRTANTRLTPSGVETLHRFKVFTIDVGFTELQPFDGFHRDVQILSINRRGQAVIAVVSHGDSVFQRIESDNRQHRAKGFFVHN